MMTSRRKNSRTKGKVGELELAHYLTDRGYPARRGQQFAGGGDSPDVVCPALQGLGAHIEAKRVERLNIDTAIDQCIRDSGGLAEAHLVMHRRNKRPWLVTLPLDEFLALLEPVLPAKIGVE